MHTVYMYKLKMNTVYQQTERAFKIWRTRSSSYPRREWHISTSPNYSTTAWRLTNAWNTKYCQSVSKLMGGSCALSRASTHVLPGSKFYEEMGTVLANSSESGRNVMDFCVRFVQTQSLKKSFHNSKLSSFHLMSSCNMAINMSLMRKKRMLYRFSILLCSNKRQRSTSVVKQKQTFSFITKTCCTTICDISTAQTTKISKQLRIL